MTQTYDEGVQINGSVDETQLQVKGYATQSNPLQSWEDSAADELALMTSDGRLQIGSFDAGLLATDDAFIEGFRDGLDTGKPSRGLHLLGQVSGTLSSIVDWVVQELELEGSGGISALQRALRVKLFNQNTGTMGSGAELRALDVEAINDGGGSGNAVPQVVAAQIAVTNQVNGYVETAVGLKVVIHDDSGGNLEQAYAIQTEGGTVQVGNELELPVLRPDVDPPSGFAKLFIQMVSGVPVLYMRGADGIEYKLTAEPFSPADVDGLTLWLKADAGLYEEDSFTTPSAEGQPVGGWQDQSGNGYHFTQATTSKKPTRQSDNGLPVVRGDGTDDVLVSNQAASAWKFLHDGSNWALFFVARTTLSNPDALYNFLGNGPAGSALIGLRVFYDDRAASSRNDQLDVWVGNGSTPRVYDLTNTDNTFPAGSFQVISITAQVDSSGDDVEVRRNGSLILSQAAKGATPSSSDPSDVLKIFGSYTASDFKGEFAELLIYNLGSTAMSPIDREQIERYLSNKWSALS